MTVICEECGKAYHIDPEKLEKYKGQELRVKCGECGHVTQLSRLAAEDAGGSFPGDQSDWAVGSANEDTGKAYSADGLSEEPDSSSQGESAAGKAAPARRGSILGIRGKNFILFLFIPLVLILATGIFSQQQIKELGDRITERSTDLVLEEGKDKIMQKTRNVALQAEIYLNAHPELKRQDFSDDPVFKDIMVQQVGETGYTCLFQHHEPGKDWGRALWGHPQEQIVGIVEKGALEGVFKKTLGPYFEPFWDIILASRDRKEAEGFYNWKDFDGKIRKKYMAITPINLDRPGEFCLMSTAYIDEFTNKTESLRQSAKDMARDTRNINLAILLGGLVFVGLCVFIYGNRLTRHLQNLTRATDRISVGDLEAEIDVKSKDEIGSLADAISRMQDSLRYSIERLRRHR